jgi:glycosyltransferase involved in cell wall biosynthesis
MTPKLWLDVEDLFEYARANPRPSGIQRLAFEIYKALRTRPDTCEFVRFVRHDTTRNSFRVIQFAEVEALFTNLTETLPEKEPPQLPSPILPHPPSRQFMRKLVHRLPPSLRAHVIQVILTQAAALRSLLGLFDALARGLWMRVTRPFYWLQPSTAPTSAMTPREETLSEAFDGTASGEDDPSEVFEAASVPGDILLVLGSPWSHPDYARLIAPQRARGLRFGLLVYDLIPLRRPEWCDRGLVRIFRSWFDDIYPLCDHIFAISQYTAADIALYAEKRGIATGVPVTPLPIGTSFGGVADTILPAARSTRLPKPGSYALIVSTIEARKNHLLLFRVWRRMLEELPRNRIPTLVFAGRVGWLVDDLMKQIANTDSLDGKLLLVKNPTDAELRTLYEGCQFTLFPSFYEGWGLPVTESLALGKPCLTSDRTSLPEAGGALTRKFDPDNLNDAYDAITKVIGDQADLARWTAQVRREFRPVSWSETAETLLATLGYAPAPAARLREIETLPLRAGARGG